MDKKITWIAIAVMFINFIIWLGVGFDMLGFIVTTVICIESTIIFFHK
jgi:hypothetical protein